MVNMQNPLNQPNKIHDKLFAESGSKTPMNVGEGLELTVASKKKSFSSMPSNVPPGGRPMISGFTDTSEGVRDHWSREYGRVDSLRQVHGRVEVKSNHPNKKINTIYG